MIYCTALWWRCYGSACATASLSLVASCLAKSCISPQSVFTVPLPCNRAVHARQTEKSPCAPLQTLQCKGQKTTDNMWAAKHPSKLPNTTLAGMAASAARHMQRKTFEKVIGVVPKGARATTINRFHRQGTPQSAACFPSGRNTSSPAQPHVVHRRTSSHCKQPITCAGIANSSSKQSWPALWANQCLANTAIVRRHGLQHTRCWVPKSDLVDEDMR